MGLKHKAINLRKLMKWRSRPYQRIHDKEFDQQIHKSMKSMKAHELGLKRKAINL